MRKRITTQVFDITANDEVTLHPHGDGDSIWYCLALPGEVSLFFDGRGDDDMHNLLGFLDRLHAIRNAVLQDQADRQTMAP
jgi:hypothetical protein